MNSPPPIKARWSLLLLFLVCGVLAASWVPYIAMLQSRHALDSGRLGLTLLARAIGSFLILPLAAWAVPALGIKRCTATAVLMACLSIVLPLAAPNVPTLVVTLLFYGFATAAFSVCINAQAVVVEHRYGRPLMSSFHAQYSVGLVVGALVQIGCAQARVQALWHLGLVALTLGAASFFLVPALLEARRVDAPPSPSLGWAIPHGLIGVLSLVVFCDIMSENCSGDWGSIYLGSVVGMPAALGGAAFAAYSFAMTCARLCGDRLVARYGGVRVLQGSGLVAGLGLGAGLALRTPLAALLGFGCLGLGVANVVPIIFSRAGRIHHLEPSLAIAILTTTGNIGLLCEPVLIGMTAQVVGLGHALYIVVVSSLCVAALAGVAMQADGRTEETPPQ